MDTGASVATGVGASISTIYCDEEATAVVSPNVKSNRSTSGPTVTGALATAATAGTGFSGLLLCARIEVAVLVVIDAEDPGTIPPKRAAAIFSFSVNSRFVCGTVAAGASNDGWFQPPYPP